MTRKTVTKSILCILLATVPAALTAQEAGPDYIPKTADGVAEGKSPGWHPLLRFSGNFALGQSANVPGTPDGVSLQFGYIAFGGLDFLSPRKTQEWTNGLGLELAYTKTPALDPVIKSVDRIDFRSTYLYHPPKIPWLGPFVAFRLTAPMLPGYLRRADPTDVVILEPGETLETDDDGQPIVPAGEVDSYDAEERIDLTGAFAPMTLRESVGLFAIPLEKPAIKTDFRLGFGAWEILVREGLADEDNADTAIYELRRMQDSFQLGPELGIMLTGAYKENVKYGASALFMQPVYHTAETDLKGFELLNMEFEVSLGFKVFKFLSIDYSFKAYKQPLIVDEWQIQNNLLVSIAFEVPSPAPPPAACPECPPAPVCPECSAAPSQDDEAPAAPEADRPAEAADPAAAPADPTATDVPEAAAPEAPASEAAAPSEGADAPATADPTEAP